LVIFVIFFPFFPPPKEKTKSYSYSLLYVGDVVLEKISVKKQALDKLNLPIDVKQGFDPFFFLFLP